MKNVLAEKRKVTMTAKDGTVVFEAGPDTVRSVL